MQVDATVALAHHTECLRYGLFRLVKRNSLLRRFNQRRIKIIHVKLVDTEQLLAQTHIPVQLVKILMHRLNQRMIHAHGNLRCIQRRFQRRGIPARLREKFQLLDLPAEHRGNRVFIRSEARIQALKGIFPQRPVG